MSMIACVQCSKPIPVNALLCPYCGKKNEHRESVGQLQKFTAGIKHITETDTSALLGKIKKYNTASSNLLGACSFISFKTRTKIITDYCEVYDQALTVMNGLWKPLFGTKKMLLSFIEQFESFNSKVDKHNESFISTGLERNKEYFDKILERLDPKINLDNEQRKAILADDDVCLLVAGAGTGKTTTLAAKIKYLVEEQNVDPQEILVFSFMRKAVDELRESVNTKLEIPAEIKTFHSFGYNIIRSDLGEPPQLCTSTFGILSSIIIRIVRSDNDLLSKIVFFMGYYFDIPEGVFKYDSIDQYHQMKRSRNYESLKSDVGDYISTLQNLNSRSKRSLAGEFLRSTEEVHIANYLYLNGFDYEYEKIYPYPIPGSRKKYTPDFFIRQDDKEVYLEHFGLDENGNNDRYSQENLDKYRTNIEKKRAHHKEHGTTLLETRSVYNDGRSLIQHLEEVLISSGFTPHPIDPDVVYEKILENSIEKYVWRFVDFADKFIGLFKVAGNGSGGFDALKNRTDNVRTLLFLEIIERIYNQYQEILYARNEVDFADMINDAEKQLCEMKKLSAKLPYRYIIIDEFQDVAKQRFELIKRISDVTDAKIVAVGDDWQSIYAFAGSDVTLFTKFRELMGGGTELKITRTYRNSQELIDIAGSFIQCNPEQITKRLLSDKSLPNPIKVKSIDGRRSGFVTALSETLSDTIGEILEEFGEDSTILILSRYGFDKKKLVDSGCFEDTGKTKIRCIEHPEADIDFLTAHRSKGLGYDNVIIMNMSEGKYGFPCQISDDPIMRLVTHSDENIEFAEERRLFYVALTRTKNRVYVLAPNNNPSRFLIELFKNHGVERPNDMKMEAAVLKENRCKYCGYPLKYEMNKTYGMKLYICTNDPEVCGCISNNNRYPYTIRKCPNCTDGYLIVKTKDSDVFYGCTSYKFNKTGCDYMARIQHKGKKQIDDSDDFA